MPDPQLPETRALLDRGYRYALALTHDPETAEDLVHDAWIRVHGRMDTVAYFITTIRNAFLDLRRRAQVVPFEPLPDEVRAPGGRHDEALAMKDEVGVALATLSVDERESLFLNAVE
ncbi:MAG: RNA polymerase sigma factor, partial [Myxococcota bacterium]